MLGIEHKDNIPCVNSPLDIYKAEFVNKLLKRIVRGPYDFLNESLSHYKLMSVNVFTIWLICKPTCSSKSHHGNDAGKCCKNTILKSYRVERLKWRLIDSNYTSNPYAMHSHKTYFIISYLWSFLDLIKHGQIPNGQSGFRSLIRSSNMYY